MKVAIIALLGLTNTI
jgi:hypothetical protein